MTNNDPDGTPSVATPKPGCQCPICEELRAASTAAYNEPEHEGSIYASPGAKARPDGSQGARRDILAPHAVKRNLFGRQTGLIQRHLAKSVKKAV